jgi:hypothetical protein
VLLVEDGEVCDVFDVVEVAHGVVVARSPFLFEVGEELELRIEDGSEVHEAIGRVRAHVGRGGDKLTELEISERSDSGRTVTG